MWYILPLRGKLWNYIFLRVLMLNAFNGTQHLSVDGKGRIVIPTVFRDDLKELSDGDLIISEDIHETCVSITTKEEWENIKKIFSKNRSFTAEYRELQRIFFGPNKKCKMDGNGRVLIPKELRMAAEIQNKAVLVGCADRLELWSEKNWTEHRVRVKSQIKSDKYSEILDKLTG